MVAGSVIEGYAISGAVAAIFYTEPTDTVDLSNGFSDYSPFVAQKYRTLEMSSLAAPGHFLTWS